MVVCVRSFSRLLIWTAILALFFTLVLVVTGSTGLRGALTPNRSSLPGSGSLRVFGPRGLAAAIWSEHSTGLLASPGPGVRTSVRGGW